MDLYRRSLSAIQKKIQEFSNVPNSNIPMFPFLSYEIQQIQTHLNRLSPNPRNKRSIELIGSAWKWIAGTPDKHDFQIINEKINNVISNNNQQRIINNLLLVKKKRN